VLAPPDREFEWIIAQKKETKFMAKKYNLENLRQVDFTRFINTPIREVSGKKLTLCPFHTEGSPSFFIYPDNSYHCFGCGTHGNAIDFLIKKLGYSFEHACSILEEL